MPTGSVILFKEDRGYGFIKPSDGEDNVYLHISEVQASGLETLAVGQRLTYDVLSQDGKKSATNLKLLD